MSSGFFRSPKQIFYSCFYCFKHFIFLLLLSIILTEFWCRNDLCNVFWFCPLVFPVFFVFHFKIFFFFDAVYSLKIALFSIGSWMQATCVRKIFDWLLLSIWNIRCVITIPFVQTKTMKHENQTKSMSALNCGYSIGKVSWKISYFILFYRICQRWFRQRIWILNKTWKSIGYFLFTSIQSLRHQRHIP